jgi:hypothetical protein
LIGNDGQGEGQQAPGKGAEHKGNGRMGLGKLKKTSFTVNIILGVNNNKWGAKPVFYS